MATPIPKNEAVVSAWDFAGDADVRVSGDGRVARGVVTDSRAVVPGCAFFAIKGESFDGNDYVDAAIAAGAALVVTERDVRSDAADVVVVRDALVALGRAASNHLAAWRRARVGTDAGGTIAITGSAGKTTTKQIAAALASTLGPACATPGNLNNRVGLPMVAFTVEPRHRFAVLEAGMSLRGEIAALVEIARPDVAVITNIGVAHAEGVGGTRADVAREKGALYMGLGPRGVAVVNADDAAAMGQLRRSRASHSLTFGSASHADYRLLSITSRGFDGVRITFERPCEACAAPRAKETLEVDSPLLGDAAAIDFLAALAAVEATCGHAIDPASVQSAMITLSNAGQRGDVIRLKDGTTVIDDTYNANPNSMHASLRMLAQLAKQQGRRAVAVLGEMKELGAVSDEEHARIAESFDGVSLVIGCGGKIGLALDRAKPGVTVEKCADVDQAVKATNENVRANDVVLAKASRSVGAERVVAALVVARGKAS
jgi:UDP-N-acetylmuramoyl-tripeptide--D-alanyl-D-alanine ligase